MENSFAVGFNFKFISSHKASEHKTQYTGLMDPNTICQGASFSSLTFFYQFNLVFTAFENMLCTQMCSSTRCIQSSTRAIKWNWKFTIANIPYLFHQKTSCAPLPLQPTDKIFRFNRSCIPQIPDQAWVVESANPPLVSSPISS
jgi:hypothetical protein